VRAITQKTIPLAAAALVAVAALSAGCAARDPSSATSVTGFVSTGTTTVAGATASTGSEEATGKTSSAPATASTADAQAEALANELETIESELDRLSLPDDSDFNGVAVP
jgi:type IV pilus biogenesis protein CpaD/CtpE